MLEEFEKAVQSSYYGNSSEEARDRHREFIVAIKNQNLKIEKYLQESASSEGKTPVPWVHLDEGECNELALFLSAPPLPRDKKLPPKVHGRASDLRRGINRESAPDFLKNASQSIEFSSSEVNNEKSYGHRRTASASPDIGAWKIAIVDDVLQQNSSNGQRFIPPRRVPSSGALSSTESAVKGQWSKNGIRKSATARHQESDAEFSRPPELARGNDECCEKGSGCVDCNDKQPIGWYGAIKRRLQRSKHQLKNSRPTQIAIWAFLVICLIVLIVLQTI
ncbi:uncharacterized protein [Gossypium hirsutum]|uniref:Uncharacterized protein isoform X2 n=2 Tax=Gossypium TaxID=3633 RepID=A0ABM2ZPB4_GOSHI|nr:uncharacterized protein LOC107910309 isoform X2 [Gossypium hirsutum]TYH83160.1 hypothetical protein ES332_D02G113500v1 [Gossypium tomentosum]